MIEGILCLIDFAINLSVNSDKINTTKKENIYNFNHLLIQISKHYKGNYVISSSTNKDSILIGSAYFRDEYTVVKSEISNTDSLLKLIKLLENTDNIYKIVTGFYNLLVVDNENKKAFLYNSSFGMRPIYYYKTNNGILISTNPWKINSYLNTSLPVNLSSVLQYIIFNYPLTEETIYENIFSLPSGSVLKFCHNMIKISRVFDSIELMNSPIYNYKDSVNLIDYSLDKIISKFVGEKDNFSTSLTGGWDGRLIISYLFGKGYNLNTYSFGSINSPDIIIPNNISKTTSINHTAYILDSNYYQTSFIELAKRTVLYGNGLRSITKSHYLLAIENELNKRAFILTGICGSNLMKSYAAPGSVFNHSVYRFLVEPNYSDFISFITSQLNELNIFDLGFRMSDFVNMVNKLEVLYDENKSINNEDIRVFRFLLNNIERKYFGTEIMTYSYLGENYSPFIDLGFIETLTMTPFFGGYKKSRTSNIFINWRNSQLYASIINKRSPTLGKFISDKGVSLSDLEKLYMYPFIALMQWKRKRFQNNRIKSNYDHSQGIKILFDLIASKCDDKEIGIISRLIQRNNERSYNLLSYLLWNILTQR